MPVPCPFNVMVVLMLNKVEYFGSTRILKNNSCSSDFKMERSSRNNSIALDKIILLLGKPYKTIINF